jgi:UDP-galactopyranose mutase
MKVAIIGAGPAGCSAAWFLKQKGIYDIVVYDREAHPGGCARTNFIENIPYEFGPQILFSDREDLRAVFERFLTNTPPPSPDKRYRYLVSLTEKLDAVFDFPITPATILKLPNAEEILWELYNLNLEQPDRSSFESYAISRVGPSLYKAFMENYNRKAWQMEPREMDTDWVQFRPIKLSRKGARFDDQWQGHPGNYNPMWEGMLEGVRFERAECSVDQHFRYHADGSRIEADLVVTTMPLSDQLAFVDTFLAYVLVKCAQTRLPAAFVTFPNAYRFVRVFEYKQQFMVESDFTLISFDFPCKGYADIDGFMAESRAFCQTVLGCEIQHSFYIHKKRVYPSATRANSALFEACLDEIIHKPVVPLGRGGMHAYCSKDTVVRMGMECAEHVEELLDARSKKARILEMRKNLH